MQLWKRRSFPPEENVNKFCSMSGNDKIDYQNFQKKFINILLWIQKTNFRQAHWKLFGERPKSCCSGSGNDKKTNSFQRMTFHHKNHRDRLLQVWQPRWNISDKRQNFFARCPKMMKNIILFLKKIFSSKNSDGQEEFSFDNTANQLLTKGQKVVAHTPTPIEKL